jgi:hypothetical protein
MRQHAHILNIVQCQYKDCTITTFSGEIGILLERISYTGRAVRVLAFIGGKIAIGGEKALNNIPVDCLDNRPQFKAGDEVIWNLDSPGTEFGILLELAERGCNGSWWTVQFRTYTAGVGFSSRRQRISGKDLTHASGYNPHDGCLLFVPANEQDLQKHRHCIQLVHEGEAVEQHTSTTSAINRKAVESMNWCIHGVRSL